jgi:hypothetical protein
MSLFLHSLVLLVMGFSEPTTDQAAVDSLLDRFQKAHAKLESLTVEFDIHTKDRILGPREDGHGLLRIRRAAKSEFMVRYEMTIGASDQKEPKESHVVLLVGDCFYLLNPGKKQGVRFHLGGDLDRKWTVLENWFNPLIVLVDRDRSAKYFSLWIDRQDDSNTYLMAKDSGRPRSNASLLTTRARILFANKGTKDIPLGAPRQFWCDQPAGTENKIDILKWHLGPAREMYDKLFQVPDATSGWTIGDIDDNPVNQFLFGALRDR